MVALLQTLIATGVLAAQLSTTAVVKRGDRHHKVTSASATAVATSAPVAASSTAAIAVVSNAVASSATTYWKPAAGTTWQIELSGTVSDLTYAADVFDVDLFDTPTSTITALKANGKKVICYFSAGTYEDWRSDASKFTAADKGSAMVDWEGEWWLDTNSANVRSIMATRIQLAVTKGCNAVDPDNVDAYDNDNGLDLAESDAVNYLTYLATTAHTAGLAIGLKNAGSIVGDVLSITDFQVNEQCVEYKECALLKPFITAGKPVFHIEYPSGAPTVSAAAKTKICSDASRSGFSTVLKDMGLDAWISAC